ncbi:hypothetical protein RHECNPAF_750048 [Rhizobium etli CNPAF512]|nr:hypothetical protein RHECNPAF_750048 [Rhizobium etli CNPAF512]
MTVASSISVPSSIISPLLRRAMS